VSFDNNEIVAEKELYRPIKVYLQKAFEQKFGQCYLEITASGVFSDELKRAVRNDIAFAFIGKKASPDLTGFIYTIPLIWGKWTSSDIQDFITVEIKSGKITIQDVYQAKMYGDLFQAKYALLISPESIPEEIRRLDERLFCVTYRYMSGWYLYIAKWSSYDKAIIEHLWLPKPPYQD
jgi:hypothetical protein